MVAWVQDLLTHPVYSRAHFLPYLWVSRLEAASQIASAPGRVLWGNETVISGRNLRPLHLQIRFVTCVSCWKAAHIATRPTFKFRCLSDFIVILWSTEHLLNSVKTILICLAGSSFSFASSFWLLTMRAFFCCRGHGRVELYLYPPSGPHRACNANTSPFYTKSILVNLPLDTFVISWNKD